MREYFDHIDELTVSNGIILHKDRIVIPKTLRLRTMERIHEGHAGINGSINRAKQSVFWLNMTADIK